MKKPSVTVITKNEARDIADCFESVTSADDIIILKPGSATNTAALWKMHAQYLTKPSISKMITYSGFSMGAKAWF